MQYWPSRPNYEGLWDSPSPPAVTPYSEESKCRPSDQGLASVPGQGVAASTHRQGLR